MRFRGEVDGNLWRKRGHASCLDTIYVIVQGPAPKQAPPTNSPKPVKCIVVLQILAAPAPLHVFNHMVLQKLFEELHSLLPGHLRPKVAVAAEQLVEPVHSSRGSEAGGIVTKVLPVFPEGHTRPEQTRHLVPLKYSETILNKLYSKTPPFFFEAMAMAGNYRCNFVGGLQRKKERKNEKFWDFKYWSTPSISLLYKKIDMIEFSYIYCLTETCLTLA